MPICAFQSFIVVVLLLPNKPSFGKHETEKLNIIKKNFCERL